MLSVVVGNVVEQDAVKRETIKKIKERSHVAKPLGSIVTGIIIIITNNDPDQISSVDLNTTRLAYLLCCIFGPSLLVCLRIRRKQSHAVTVKKKWWSFENADDDDDDNKKRSGATHIQEVCMYVCLYVQNPRAHLALRMPVFHAHYPTNL